MKGLKLFTQYINSSCQEIYDFPVNGYLKNSGINFNPVHDS
jgi:hypothetical protein